MGIGGAKEKRFTRQRDEILREASKNLVLERGH